MATLSELQAAQAAALTDAFKLRQNRAAAKTAALIALYYRTRVDPDSVSSVERWLEIVIPRLIRDNDTGAREAATFFDAIRRVEVGQTSQRFAAEPSLGTVDEGVRRSLLTMGPYDYQNKMRKIESLDIRPQQREAMIAEAKQVTAGKVAAAALRHAQAGARQTIWDNSQRDQVALGYVRVTRADPCYFCAMLASRGLRYRAYKEGAFEASDARFTGDGDAKVHDNCSCSLKPVYADNDPVLGRTEKFADMWSRWGAGGGDAALRFRRGYEHFQETGSYLSWDEANEGLRAA